MKQSVFLKIMVIGSLALGSQAFAKNPYEAGNYQIDPMHSRVGFEIPHLVISSVEGRFDEFEGSIDLAEKFQSSKFTSKVQVESIDTNVKKRDKHLKSEDFFDADKYPTMTFESTKIKGTPKSFKIVGNLTMKGVTKEVQFSGKILGSVKDGYGNQKVALEATTEMNRKDFGLTWNSMVEAGPVVGEKVTITLKLQAAKTEPKKN